MTSIPKILAIDRYTHSLESCQLQKDFVLRMLMKTMGYGIPTTANKLKHADAE
ncbi:MAG: hypothetical protein WCF23_10815 [Candidatus Nitrosopolaris sp.]